VNIVVVAPHPDDAELGMGGTIARMVDDGHSVLIVDMTDGEPTPKGTPARRRQEAEDATRILGCQRLNLGLPNRSVVHGIEARHQLAAVLRAHRCDVVFAPHPDDAHPDHIAVTRITEDARFDAKLSNSTIPGDPIHPRRLIHYYCTHLRAVPAPTFALDISATAERKRASILAYHPGLPLAGHRPRAEPHAARSGRRARPVHGHAPGCRARRAVLVSRTAGDRRHRIDHLNTILLAPLLD